MLSVFAEEQQGFMREALAEARLAGEAGEIPVGCVIVRDGSIIARAHNLREQLADPTAHAEILALRQASRVLGSRRLHDCILYVTLEPCPMCAGAILMAELKACFFGAADPAQGCVQSVYALTRDPAFFHQVPAYGGLMEEACSGLIKNFFMDRRNRNEN